MVSFPFWQRTLRLREVGSPKETASLPAETPAHPVLPAGPWAAPSDSGAGARPPLPGWWEPSLPGQAHTLLAKITHFAFSFSSLRVIFNIHALEVTAHFFFLQVQTSMNSCLFRFWQPEHESVIYLPMKGGVRSQGRWSLEWSRGSCGTKLPLPAALICKISAWTQKK